MAGMDLGTLLLSRVSIILSETSHCNNKPTDSRLLVIIPLSVIIPSAPGIVVAVQKTHPVATVQRVQWFKSQKLTTTGGWPASIQASSSSLSQRSHDAGWCGGCGGAGSWAARTRSVSSDKVGNVGISGRASVQSEFEELM